VSGVAGLALGQLENERHLEEFWDNYIRLFKNPSLKIKKRNPIPTTHLYNLKELFFILMYFSNVIYFCDQVSHDDAVLLLNKHFLLLSMLKIFLWKP